MPRQRKFDPTIPAHIDQEHLPKGIYWQKRGQGRWVVFGTGKNGKPTMETVATPNALLSDLHRIAEEIQQGRAQDGSIEGLFKLFEESATFRTLKPKTRQSYQRCGQVICQRPTKLGRPFGKLETARLSNAILQRLIDAIAEQTPTTAKRCSEYMRRVFRWGLKRGHVQSNPAEGLEPPKLQPKRRLPSHAAHRAVLNFAVERGSSAHRTGTVAPYLWIVMELAYLCHMRTVEVRELAESQGTKDGVIATRTKGSRTSGFYWSDRLRAAWTSAIEQRDQIWQRRRQPVPIHAKDRPVLVNQTGGKISEQTMKSAWQRMINLAVDEGVISPEDRFGLHDLKRRGITDRKGLRHEKREAGGHKTDAMLDVYDFSVPFFETAEAEEESGDEQAPKRPEIRR